MTDERASERITVAVAGDGDGADRWLRALRGVDETSASRLRATDDEFLQTLARDDVNAIAFAGNTADLPGAIKRALMANRHVLVFGATAIASKQIATLDALARRRARVLLFATEYFGDERIDFVRKMIAGPQPLWRPRYLRSLRTGAVAGASIDALAIADIAFASAMLGAAPSRVSAIAPRIDDESGAGDVALVTLMFDGGPAGRIDISIIEPAPRHDVTIACEGRTIALDSYDGRSVLQVHASGRSRGRSMGVSNGAWSETVTEQPVAVAQDRVARASAAFVRTVRARDLAASNARAMCDAARVWERARESIAQSGAMIEIDPQREAERPKLQLIVGGGHADYAHPAPALTVIDGGRPATRAPLEDPDPEPLRSA
jgi:predicted dehydrogenase